MDAYQKEYQAGYADGKRVGGELARAAIGEDLQHVVDRLEAWADTHKGLAQRTWDGPEGTAHLNQAMNYQALANTLKRHINPVESTVG